jgi:hypothetical protein
VRRSTHPTGNVPTGDNRPAIIRHKQPARLHLTAERRTTFNVQPLCIGRVDHNRLRSDVHRFPLRTFRSFHKNFRIPHFFIREYKRNTIRVWIVSEAGLNRASPFQEIEFKTRINSHQTNKVYDERQRRYTSPSWPEWLHHQSSDQQVQDRQPWSDPSGTVVPMVGWSIRSRKGSSYSNLNGHRIRRRHEENNGQGSPLGRRTTIYVFPLTLALSAIIIIKKPSVNEKEWLGVFKIFGINFEDVKSIHSRHTLLFEHGTSSEATGNNSSDPPAVSSSGSWKMESPSEPPDLPWGRNTDGSATALNMIHYLWSLSSFSPFFSLMSVLIFSPLPSPLYRTLCVPLSPWTGRAPLLPPHYVVVVSRALGRPANL